MLRIADTIVELIAGMRPAVEAIGRHDADLARQLRRALSSVALNVGEGSGSRGGRRPSHYSIALGSAQEALMAVRTAEAWGYIPPIPRETRDAFAKVIATLVKVSRS